MSEKQQGVVHITTAGGGALLYPTISQPYLAEWMIVNPDGQVKHFDDSWMPPQPDYLWERYDKRVA